MLSPRRFLPSTALLCAFEAAARTSSFTRAAEELNLTQSAVSRQIKALEEQIGVALFMRERQKVNLTLAGETYARDVREALQMIANASMTLRTNPDGGALNLAILPTFGTRWLAPRLPDFLKDNPGVTVNLTTRLRPFDFSTEPQDAAIHFGQHNWPDTDAMFLHDETVVPTCSPDLLEHYDIQTPVDLLKAPILHLATRPKAWERWLHVQGIDGEKVPGMVFDQFATVAQAVVHGIGIALLPHFLIENELSEGTLVPALNLPVRSVGAYHLVWPKSRSTYPPLKSFRDWIGGQAEA